MLAGECGLPFINVDLTDALSAEAVCGKIKTAFVDAEKSGEYTVVFIDEIDKVLPDESRDYISDQEKRVLTQLLTLIDGLKSSGNIFFAATCNNYGAMPGSLVRAGRIDKKIYLGLPNRDSRVAILDYYINKTQCKFEFNSERIAALCINFSGAEIQTFVNECVIGSDDNNFVSKNLIYKKLNEISSENICDEDEFKNTKLQAVHSVGHFLVAQTLHPSKYLLGANNDEGNSFFTALSTNTYYDDEDDDDYDYADEDDEDDGEKEREEEIKAIQSKDFSREDFIDYLSVAAGGYAAEKLFLGTTYSECAKDFREIDWAVGKMSYSGMLGYEYYYDSDKEYSEAYLERFMIKKNELVKAAVERAEKIITENRQLAEYLVSLLLKSATISQEELDPVIKDFMEEHKQ
ncbi:MAG: ATP-binding protein [Clostridia bacterium]|nr:ATP-binding protein [Clostridia bacterium]